MDQKACPSCGAMNDASVAKCTSCGADMASQPAGEQGGGMPPAGGDMPSGDQGSSGDMPAGQ